MDHGFIYESHGDLQRLFGTSYDSVSWQLQRMGCEIINQTSDKSELLAAWNTQSEPAQVVLDISFKNGLADKIRYREHDTWSFTGDGITREFKRRE